MRHAGSTYIHISCDRFNIYNCISYVNVTKGRFLIQRVLLKLIAKLAGLDGMTFHFNFRILRFSQHVTSQSGLREKSLFGVTLTEAQAL